MRDHYEKLLGYKDDLNNIIQKCNSAIGKYEAMEAGVEAVSHIPISESYSQSYAILNSSPIQKVKYDSNTGGYVYNGYTTYGTIDHLNVTSPGINKSDDIKTKLAAL